MKNDDFAALKLGWSDFAAGRHVPGGKHTWYEGTAEELLELRSLKTQPSHSTIWANIESWANDHLTDSPLAEPTTGDKSKFAGTNTKVRRHIETMAFMYAMTDNTAYADSAINWMVSVAGWSSWGVASSLWFNETILMRGYAFAYSVLRYYMTTSQRATVITPLEREIIASRTEYLDPMEGASIPMSFCRVCSGRN